jgi:hypothetical protein
MCDLLRTANNENINEISKFGAFDVSFVLSLLNVILLSFAPLIVPYMVIFSYLPSLFSQFREFFA